MQKKSMYFFLMHLEVVMNPFILLLEPKNSFYMNFVINPTKMDQKTEVRESVRTEPPKSIL